MLRSIVIGIVHIIWAAFAILGIIFVMSVSNRASLEGSHDLGTETSVLSLCALVVPRMKNGRPGYLRRYLRSRKAKSQYQGYDLFGAMCCVYHTMLRLDYIPLSITMDEHARVCSAIKTDLALLRLAGYDYDVAVDLLCGAVKVYSSDNLQRYTEILITGETSKRMVFIPRSGSSLSQRSDRAKY